jgi:hypothetical protein
LNLVDARQFRRSDCDQHADANPHEAEPEDAARRRQQQALGEHLAQETCASGAECGANRNLFLACGTAREKQVRDVHAGHQQHEANARQQQHERRANAADGLIVQRHDVGAQAAVHVGVLLRQASGDGNELLLRLRDGDVRRQPADDAQVMRQTHRNAVADEVRARHVERHPRIRFDVGREAARSKHRFERKVKV